jgi:low temperature requirement protein LtrA
MTARKRSFRTWWQVPRRAGEQLEHRQVSFLELFYDLVYVALIDQLSHALSSHVGWAALGGFTFMFVIVWWAWLNGSIYHDLHGNDDIRTRVFTFLQMFSVVGMAAFAQDALGESSVGFALSYAAFQLILTYLWWRTGVHDPNHRPLSRPYSVVFLVNTLLFAGSIFVPAPQRFYLWGIALTLSLLLPVYIVNLGKWNPKAQPAIDVVSTVRSSLVERFDLFTIIVLGEVVVGVVAGVAQHRLPDWRVGGTAALGVLIAIGLWWVYFDFVAHHAPHANTKTAASWLYLHLPLTIGVTAVGASVFSVVGHAEEPWPSEGRWLLMIATAITLVSTAALMRTTRLEARHRRTHEVAQRVMLVSAILVILLGFTNLEAIPLLIAVVLLLLAPVFFAFRVWLETFGGEAAPSDASSARPGPPRAASGKP